MRGRRHSAPLVVALAAGCGVSTGGSPNPSPTPPAVPSVDPPDFAPSEKFTTSSAGYFGWVAWDATKIYFGMDGTDVASGSSTRWVVAYVEGSGGSATGVTYNTQQPALPFPAKFHLRWKADNSF